MKQEAKEHWWEVPRWPKRKKEVRSNDSKQESDYHHSTITHQLFYCTITIARLDSLPEDEPFS